MSRRRCCCGCVIYTDDFDRDDGPLGDDWVASGTAAIDTNTAKITSGNIVYQNEVVDPQGSFIVTFDTVDSQDGDIYDFFVFDDDGNVLLTVRFTADSVSGNWIICLRYKAEAWYCDNVEMLAGCGTYQEPFLAGRGFTISFDRLNLRVGGTTPEAPHYELWKCVGDIGADIAKVGFGHGGGPRAIWIDNFELSDHYVHHTDCPYPGCLCGVRSAVCWPDTLYLELTNPDGCYVQLPSPSTTITLNRVYRSQAYWTSAKVLGCYGCTTETWFYHQFHLYCQFEPGKPGFVLWICYDFEDMDTECEVCDGVIIPPNRILATMDTGASTCDPLYLKFSIASLAPSCECEPDDCDCGDPDCDPLIAEVTE